MATTKDASKRKTPTYLTILALLSSVIPQILSAFEKGDDFVSVSFKLSPNGNKTSVLISTLDNENILFRTTATK